MSEKRLQKRDEISDEYKWKLEDMYETDELWEAECEKASQLAEKISGLKGHLSDSAASLLDFFKKQDELSYYLQKPLESTILVLCHKHGVLDRRKKLAAEIEKVGVLFESKKIKDTQLAGFITSYLKRKSIEIEPKASEMMAEFVGTDLSRMAGELEKLIITLPKGQKRITPEQIEQNIGISKDYNNYELRNALIIKDVFKANQIIKYFEENPKTNPLQMTLSVLFNFFSNLMLAYYAPEKSEQGIAAQLGLKSPWQSKDYLAAMRKYSGVKVMQIIGEIRYCDAKSKGVGNSSLGDGELLRELVYKILH